MDVKISRKWITYKNVDRIVEGSLRKGFFYEVNLKSESRNGLDSPIGNQSHHADLSIRNLRIKVEI